ncbi:MAG: hypothetical protein HYT83_00800 [Candidatus Levybacteria bacterium]|nr:hypothetical protein [Candidatus Levybacteria bacterium]
MDKKQEETSLMHDFSQANNSALFSRKIILFLIVVAFLGVGSGYLLSKNSVKVGQINLSTGGENAAQKGMVVGSNDTKTFKDSAEGKLENGGIEDEGQYHLVRPGGDSQNVYLVSSVIDLSKFIGKKVRVWGETQKAQKAGWLMDVGRVEVLE